MNALMLHEAIRHAIFTERDARERWDSLRTSLAKRLKMSAEQADEILDFIEVSHVDQRIRDACNEWASKLDPRWHTNWHVGSIRCARSAAYEARKRAVYLLEQHCQCTELRAHSILRFLTAGARGSRFYSSARSLARTFELNWRQLVIAAIGGRADDDAVKARGRAFQGLLTRTGITDEEFAVRAGIDLASVQDWKDGTLDPTLQDSFDSAEALGIPWEELIAYFSEIRPGKK